MTAAVILDFRNFWNFNGRHGQEGRITSRCKFRRNRSCRCRDMAIFRFFNMAAAAILDF